MAHFVCFSASLQIRAGRSTRSLEYRTARDTLLLNFTARSTLNKQVCVRKKETLTKNKREWADACLLAFDCVDLMRNEDFLCIFFPSPTFLFHPSTILSFSSDVISPLSSGGTGQSIDCRWAVCFCVQEEISVSIMTWAPWHPNLHYSGGVSCKAVLASGKIAVSQWCMVAAFPPVIKAVTGLMRTSGRCNL